MSGEIFAKNLIVHELVHLFLALIVGFHIYRKFKSIKLVLIVLLVTFLIDIDHFFEAFLVKGFDFYSIFKSFQGNYFRESGKMTIFFHSWELLPIILFLGKKSNKFSLSYAIVFAAAGHYLVDNFIYSSLYGMSLLEYSFIYRGLNNFDFWRLCGGC